MSRLLLLAALVGAASALTCYTCDSFLTCNDPRVEFCPIATTCYTLRRNGQVALKGCTAGCSTLPYNNEPGVQCTECNNDKCNSGSHAGSPGRYDQQQPNFNNEILKKRRSIGHGTGVEQRSQIGSGVSGGSGGGYNAYGNNGGVGNHQHDNKHGHQIGHGAQGGIGGGAAPNRHHHRERRSGHSAAMLNNANVSGTGIGGGVRPRAAAASLTIVPMSLAIVRLFQ